MKTAIYASGEVITQAEYARRRGCTEGAVRRAIRDGRITLIDGKIDPVAADAQWRRNTRVRMGSRSTAEAAVLGARRLLDAGESGVDEPLWRLAEEIGAIMARDDGALMVEGLPHLLAVLRATPPADLARVQLPPGVVALVEAACRAPSGGPAQ